LIHELAPGVLGQSLERQGRGAPGSAPPAPADPVGAPAPRRPRAG
jgi:hypothetical protein